MPSLQELCVAVRVHRARAILRRLSWRRSSTLMVSECAAEARVGPLTSAAFGSTQRREAGSVDGHRCVFRPRACFRQAAGMTEPQRMAPPPLGKGGLKPPFKPPFKPPLSPPSKGSLQRGSLRGGGGGAKGQSP